MKKALCLLAGIALCAAGGIFWVKHENGDFLPQAKIAVAAAEWEGRYYTLVEDRRYQFEAGNFVAKDGSYYLTAIEGDGRKDYHLLSIYSGDWQPELVLEAGYEIPSEGTVTGVIMQEYQSFSPWTAKYLEQKAAAGIISLMESGDCEKLKAALPADKWSRLQVYFCYDNFPVSSTPVGFLVKSANGWTAIPGTEDPFVETDGFTAIREGTSCSIVQDEATIRKIERCLNRK